VRLKFDRQQVVEAIGKDKKREGERLNFVLLKKLGEAVVREIYIQDIVELLEDTQIE
jgi:3-dehydroquinate synthase